MLLSQNTFQTWKFLNLHFITENHSSKCRSSRSNLATLQHRGQINLVGGKCQDNQTTGVLLHPTFPRNTSAMNPTKQPNGSSWEMADQILWRTYLRTGHVLWVWLISTLHRSLDYGTYSSVVTDLAPQESSLCSSCICLATSEPLNP